MKVLISLLGLAPGVVTGAYYALYNGWGVEKPVRVNKVVTLGTSEMGVTRFEEEIAREFTRWHREKGKSPVQYDKTCRLRINAEDVNDEKSISQFQAQLIELLQTYQDDEVYLVVAGGRKSMAALAATAVQVYGRSVKGMYHLYIDKDLEEDGSSSRFWLIDSQRRQLVMRPPANRCWLVQIPFFFIQENGELELRGEVNENLVEAIENRLERLDEKGREKYWDYVFEAKVAEYLRDKRYKGYEYDKVYFNYKHPRLLRKLEIDVYAEFSHERFEKCLVVECKLRHIDNPDDKPIDVGAVNQVIRRLKAFRDSLAAEVEAQGRELRLEGWVVCNAGTVDPDAWQKAQENGIKLFQARLPGRWRGRARDWQIVGLEEIHRPKRR